MNRNLSLVEQGRFGAVNCDFYSDGNQVKMAICADPYVVAKAGACLCGGTYDCYYDHDANGWYAMCNNCMETGPTKDDWQDAAHCYPLQD